MPPLKSFPEVTLALTQEELNNEFDKFRAGESSFVQARAQGRTYNLFQPADSDCHAAVFGLMMDGIVVTPAVAEWFNDYDSYEEKRTGIPQIDFEDVASIQPMQEVKAGRVRTLLGKLMGR